MAQKKLILLVEDDPTVSDLVKEVLVQHDFEVEKAFDGEEALGKISAQHDLIILDLGLPKISGLEVLKKIKQDEFHRSKPVIILTGRTDSNTIFDAMETGSYDYLIKPVKLEELIRTIKRALLPRE
ncbi:MAG: response regulator transcription factor [Candidatus Omnitrophica bacterium]|nr:response regulator transcription factor [Candidatus Omnitrophota bacterium]